MRTAAAAQLMRLLPPEQLGPLVAQGRFDPALRQAVVAQLGRVNEPEAIKFLLASLRAPDAHERRQAIGLLARYDEPQVVNALMDTAAGDADPEVREYAERMLGE